MKKLPAWMQKKWVLFALSFGTAAVLCLLIFILFLRTPLSNTLTRQGERAYESGDYEKAAARYASALYLKASNADLYMDYANALIQLEDFEKADALLSRAIARISGEEGLYFAKARLLVAKGEIGGAVDFLDSISDSYINKKIQASRPADLTFTPAQGKYSTAQKVTLTAGEGQTIYYTLNGEDPALTSKVYTGPITISATSTLTAIAMSSNGLVSPRLKISYEINNANQAIEFVDGKIERMVRAALQRPSGNLYAAQLSSVTTLTNEGIGGSIQTLSDLEYLPNLQNLAILNESSIDDFSPLSSLRSLTGLRINSCALSDQDLAYLSACTQLSALNVDDNQISSFASIKNLRYLEDISAAGNNIAATSSAAMFPLLTTLNLSGNRLCELEGISALSDLTALDVSKNYISDLSPLSTLAKLKKLNLTGNTPSNIKKLSALPALEYLDLSDCKLTSLSVVNDFKALQTLYAADNDISSLSTFQKQVAALSVSRNPLVDLSPLKSQTGLTTLEAAKTKISDLSFLSGSPSLILLDVAGTQATDSTPLQSCPNLQSLICSSTLSTAGLSSSVQITIH